MEDVRGFVENGLDAGRFLRLECEETELIEDSKDPGLDSGILTVIIITTIIITIITIIHICVYIIIILLFCTFA